MSLFDRFRQKTPPTTDADLRERLSHLVLDLLRDQDGRIRVEDALSASSTIVAERCIDLAGDFSLRDHDLIPGSRAFSTRANDLICGDVTEGGHDQIPKDSIIGTLYSRLDPGTYSASDFPDLADVFRQYAARVGDPADWGKVPLSVAAEHHPFIPPLQIGFETRKKVDEIFSSIREDRSRCLRLATESLADILNMVASAIDHKLALLLTVETINGMSKTAPMTEKAMQKVQKAN
jgi:hypothetical protein